MSQTLTVEFKVHGNLFFLLFKSIIILKNRNTELETLHLGIYIRKNVFIETNEIVCWEKSSNILSCKKYFRNNYKFQDQSPNTIFDFAVVFKRMFKILN